MEQLPEELVGRLERLAESEGVELVAIEVVGSPRHKVVRLVLDRAGGGVTLADCELVSRQASVLLDAYDPIPDPFSLEVSSPGLDRKLHGDKDYERFSGQVVRVRMRPSWRESRVVTGVLEGIEGEAIRVRDGERVHLLPRPEVFETRLHPFGDGKAAQRRRGKRISQR